jgi:hypothetical protein
MAHKNNIKLSNTTSHTGPTTGLSCTKIQTQHKTNSETKEETHKYNHVRGLDLRPTCKTALNTMFSNQ